MTHPNSPAFDAALASSLFPSLVQLAQRTTLQAAAEDPDARLAKVEVGKQATHLRSALAQLKQQAGQLPAGELSLEDQDWLVEQLEQQLEKSRLELSNLVHALPETSSTSTKTTQGAIKSEDQARSGVMDMD